METGLLILRAAVGLTFAAHGAQKLSHLFGGHGLAATGGVFESMGFRPGRLFAAMAGLGEAGGGLFFAAGLFTPLVSALLISTMLVAAWTAHLGRGFFAKSGGYEYNLVLIAVAAGVAFTGPGRLSVDAAVGLPWAGNTWGLAALGLALVGAVPTLLLRTSPAPKPAHSGAGG